MPRSAGKETFVAINSIKMTRSSVSFAFLLLPHAGDLNDTLMLFDKSKGAFRAGGYDNNAWVPDSIGMFSMALGYNARASGQHSFSIGYAGTATGLEAVSIGGGHARGVVSLAMARGIAFGDFSIALGEDAYATGYASTCFGGGSSASGAYALAIGNNASASGKNAVAIGNYAAAEARHSAAIGRYNIGGGNPTVWVDTDPLFEVGNGTSATTSNALTILKNGDTRLKHSDNSGAGGLKLENSNTGDFVRLYVSSSSADLGLVQ